MGDSKVFRKKKESDNKFSDIINNKNNDKNSNINKIEKKIIIQV